MNPKNFLDEVNKDDQQKKSEQDKANLTGAINKAGVKNVEATNRNTESTAKGLKDVRGRVEVTNNDKLAKTDDMKQVMDSIQNLNLTTFMSTKGFQDMAENIQKVHAALQTLQQQYENQGLPDASKSLGAVVDKMNSLVQQLNSSKVTVDSKLQKTIDNLSSSIDKIDFNPQVNVSAPETKVVTTPVDLKPVTDAIGKLQKSYDKLDSKEEEPVDFGPVIDGLNSVKSAIQNQTFPVPNYVLPFKDVNGKATQVQLDSSGNLPTSGGGSGGGGTQYAEGVTTSPATGNVVLGRYNTSPPTLTNGQLNAPQLDANGNLKIAIASGGGSGGTASSFGSAFPATGTAIGLSNGTNMVALTQGQTTMSASIPVTLASNQTSIPVAATLSAETTKVIGTVNQGTSPWVVGQSTASALNATVTQGAAAAIGSGWPVIGGELADTTGTFTNATQTTSVTTSSFDGYSTVIVSISGTYGTATGVFEISDDGGTTWYSVNAARTDGSAVEVGYTSLTNTNRMWTLSVSGADEFRVRSTAVASGTVNVRISVESMPTPEAASVSAYQATAANFNATVVGTGTLQVQTSAQVPGVAATNLGKAEDAVHASGDTGVFALTVANEALTNISGTDGDYTIIGSDRNGTVHVAQKASTATLSNVSTSGTSAILLSANAARIGAQITNEATTVLFVKFGTTASATSYTVSLAGAASAPYSYYEVPAGYTGRIDAILASSTGTARVTEITP